MNVIFLVLQYKWGDNKNRPISCNLGLVFIFGHVKYLYMYICMMNYYGFMSELATMYCVTPFLRQSIRFI